MLVILGVAAKNRERKRIAGLSADFHRDGGVPATESNDAAIVQ